MNKSFVLIGALVGFSWTSAGDSVAQQALPMDAAAFYGQGVHAYFSGQSAQGEAYLSTAIALNANDPRAYYFRALCLMRQGRTDEARADLQIGASIEAQQPGRFNIGTTLERVQGGDRVLVEQHRREGQLSAAQAQHQTQQARFDQSRGQRVEVLYQKPTVPLGSVLQSGSTRPPIVYQPIARPRTTVALPATATSQQAGAAAGPTDPFSDDAAATSTAQGAPPPASVGTAPATGLGTASQPPATTAAPNDNPFGEATPRATLPATPPQRTTPPAAKQAPADDNPFGDTAPRSSTTPPQSTPPSRQPATTTPPADDNPFRSA